MTVDRNRIADNVRRFHDELHAELARLGRSADSVTIVAVSKTVSADVISTAAECDLTHFGENRVQEAQAKIPQVYVVSSLTWHMVGHLQTNKAKDAVALFDLIQSVDRLELATALNHRAGMIGKRQDILIQVNTSAEPQKSGCEATALDGLVDEFVRLPHLRLMGLMTIGPLTDDRARIERSFRLLRDLFDRIGPRDLAGGEMRYCSMGMTDDWKIALASGSNMLRIGRAIFGERQSAHDA